MRRTTALGWIALLTALGACGGGDNLLLPGSGEPAHVTVVQGDQQNGRVGQPLSQPLIVAVTDASDRLVDGATIVFVLSDPAPGASVAPDTTTTNADGQATANVVLGTRPGSQTGEVQALGTGGAPTATVGFTLTALPENANGIVALSGQDQSGPVNSTLPNPLVVQVSDPFGNPITGVTVTWTVDGGAVSAGTSTTGADGTTSVTRTLGGMAGAQHTFATVDGLAGSPVTFTHTATAGAASGVTIIAGDGQTGPVSTELPQDLVVQVRDASGNAVPSVAVALNSATPIPDTTALTVLPPGLAPSVQAALARPLASVTEVVGVTLPPPTPITQATATDGTALPPASRTSTTRSCGSSVLTGPV